MSIAKLRQGCILSDEDARKLQLVDADGSVIVIISHDCDLASESDEYIEVIVGTMQAKSNSLYENARSPRCLHLNYSTLDANSFYVELKHSAKKHLSKQKIAGMQFSDVLMPTLEKKHILQQWLAARYARPAFPDAFESRLRKKVGKKDTIKRIEKIMESVSCYLLALYFDLGEDRLSELNEGQPYFLSISVVYDTIEGGPEARGHAESVAQALKELFIEIYGSPDSATDIVLEECVAIGDDEIRLSDLRKVYQWRLEHLSFQDSPPSSVMMSGQLPK